MAETGGGQTHEEAGGYRWQWRDGAIAVLALGLAASLWWARGGRPGAGRGTARRRRGGRRLRGGRRPRGPRVARGGLRPAGAGRGGRRAGRRRPGAAGRDCRSGARRLLALARAQRAALRAQRRLRARHRLHRRPHPPALPRREGQSFAGDTELEVRIDQFLVEGIEVWEEPDAEGDAVVLRGNLRFNYSVDPELLAGMIRLEDPGRRRGARDPARDRLAQPVDPVPQHAGHRRRSGRAPSP